MAIREIPAFEGEYIYGKDGKSPEVIDSVMEGAKKQIARWFEQGYKFLRIQQLPGEFTGADLDSFIPVKKIPADHYMNGKAQYPYRYIRLNEIPQAIMKEIGERSLFIN